MTEVTPEMIELVASAISPNLFRLYPNGRSQSHEKARSQARAAYAAMQAQQPNPSPADEVAMAVAKLSQFNKPNRNCPPEWTMVPLDALVIVLSALTTLQARLDAVAEWAKRTDAELRDDADKADTNYDLNIAVGGSDVLAELFAILAKDGEADENH